MEYRRGEREIVIRLDAGDEVIGALKEVCGKEKIASASVIGIGAARSLDIAHYDTLEKKYNTVRFEGMLEITSLSGNISLLDGVPVPHLHIVAGKEDFSSLAGHLMRAEIGPTCELVVTPLGIKITREMDQNTGLNLQRF